jgi:hypothetical protein
MPRRPIALALSLLAAVAVNPAQAQEGAEATGSGGWSFAFAPYLWAAGMEGKMATLPPAGPAEVDAGFDDILEDLSFAFMGIGEVRYGRFAVVADMVYVDLKDDASTPGPFFSGAKLESETFIGTFQGSYRVLAAEQGHLDMLAGARVWHVSTELDLDAGLLAARRRSDSETWVDPIIGAQGQLKLGAGFYVTALANVGGFGVGSDLTWDVFGGIGYQAWDWFAPVVGYRHLSVDYDNDGFLYDVDMSGPLIGGVIRF